MSETGATDAQIEAAAERYYEVDHSQGRYLDRYERYAAKCWAAALVPPGYVIVPAGAVVLSEKEAKLCREELNVAAERCDAIAANPVRRRWEIDRAERDAERYRALAAKLGGAS